MNIQREITISTLDEMCELIEEYYNEQQHSINDMIGFINNHIESDIEELIKGKAIKVNEIELRTLIKYINDMGINTLMIQQSNGHYYVKVDDLTVEGFKKWRDEKGVEE